VTATSRYVDQYAAYAANGGGAAPAWLRDVRQNAIARFEALGFPTMRDEDWHFTSAAPIAEVPFRAPHTEQPAAAASRVDAGSLAPFRFAPDWPTAVFVNGRYREDLSSVESAGAGVRVLELARAWREMPELLERHLTRIASFERRSFTALNTAFLHDGVVVHFAAGAAPARPVHLLFVSDSAAADGVSHLRNLIVAERGAQGAVIESYVGLAPARYLTNAVTEAHVADGATLRHVKVQRESDRAFHVHTVEAVQGRDSHFQSFSFASGAALSRTNIYTLLAGAGCGATLNGLYMVDGAQHVDHQTRIEHAEPNCFSRELYKGILGGASHGVFNGQVYVRPEAQKTDGKQTNANLLLSERARVDTKPQLEIFADDVKCTHGATVGRLDEMALFYLESRGIGAAYAKRLLTHAFAADVLETIDIAPVREALEALSLARFAGTAPGAA
jgi:Fe-S cluster assembly protein SufD